MSRLAILVFAPEDASSSGSASTDSADPLPGDIAFLAESRRHRFINFRKPYSLIFSRKNSGAGTPYNPFLQPPLLKVHIATTRESSLPAKLTQHLSAIRTDTTSEEWLDAALTALQKAGIVQRFSVAKFRQFLVDTLHKQPYGARRVSSGTTELDYLALLSSNSEVKKMLAPDPDEEDGAAGEKARKRRRTWTVCGFRISSSGRPDKLTDRRSVESWERQDDPYGGLM